MIWGTPAWELATLRGLLADRELRATVERTRAGYRVTVAPCDLSAVAMLIEAWGFDTATVEATREGYRAGGF